jgi:hypothetical protein
LLLRCCHEILDSSLLGKVSQVLYHTAGAKLKAKGYQIKHRLFLLLSQNIQYLLSSYLKILIFGILCCVKSGKIASQKKFVEMVNYFEMRIFFCLGFYSKVIGIVKIKRHLKLSNSFEVLSNA